MNKRINTLAQQAADSCPPGHIELKDFIIPYTEKLAQLIVRECIDTVSDCSVEYCTRPQIVSEIKEHFGVEEQR